MNTAARCRLGLLCALSMTESSEAQTRVWRDSEMGDACGIVGSAGIVVVIKQNGDCVGLDAVGNEQWRVMQEGRPAVALQVAGGVAVGWDGPRWTFANVDARSRASVRRAMAGWTGHMTALWTAPDRGRALGVIVRAPASDELHWFENGLRMSWSLPEGRRVSGSAPLAGARVALVVSEVGDTEGERLRLWVVDRGDGTWRLTCDRPVAGYAGSNLWGVRMLRHDDVDGDRRDDIVVTDLEYTNNDEQLPNGRVMCVSSRTGAAIWETVGDRQQEPEPLGCALAGVGDWNDDGVVDIAVGGAPIPVVEEAVGHVVVLCGRTGRELRRWTGPKEARGFGSDLAWLAKAGGLWVLASGDRGVGVPASVWVTSR